MISPFEAIEQLIAQGQRRVDHHNGRPHNTTKITLADTLEAQVAELISHYEHGALEARRKAEGHDNRS